MLKMSKPRSTKTDGGVLLSELLVEAKTIISEVNLLHLASTFDLKSVSSTGNFFQNKKGQTIILESSVHLTFPPLLKTTSGPLLSSNPPRLLLPGVHLLTPPPAGLQDGVSGGTSTTLPTPHSSRSPPQLLYLILFTLTSPISVLLFMRTGPWNLEILTLSMICLSMG